MVILLGGLLAFFGLSALIIAGSMLMQSNERQ